MRNGRRSKARLAMVAVATSALSMVALSGVAPAAESAGGKINKYRVMTWNSHGQDWSNPEMIAGVIKELKPQVIALQETCLNDVAEAQKILKSQKLAYYISYGPNVPNYACGHGPLNHGMAILSAAEVTEERNVEYPYDEGPTEKRGYQMLTTTIADKKVRVFNTHLTASEKGGTDDWLRNDQAKRLAREAGRHDRALVLGDFNAEPWSAYGKNRPMRHMFNAGFKDADRDCRPAKRKAEEAPSNHHTSAEPDGACLATLVNNEANPPAIRKFDYILLRGLTNKNIQLHTSHPTDHRIFVTDVK
ncbi:endonuclease/exonuclease/phosphatase family protein [Saccharopolyspora elongata]|uniref:Endonuclease/exonuclease/phosphatase domain-containing protein n=1 Tax=Saccharopolyspora elongata TaxID=2530387 RepID=A0A4R4ZCQ9_9PSEU|nr:endonuclease/exonuclease/phosphatase family protein [Saccharopolyspora elongata]TDD55660.1 hypothetical protein E1288_04275 [Saccharopolyspora elongata]